MRAFRLKEGMLLGVASAATQIEGGDQNNSWYDWYTKGHIHHNDDPSLATAHYRLWESDTALMGEMGVSCYRLGVEWSRIEPEEDVFDEGALAHYRAELEALRGLGVKPLLTLHHFSNPLWFEKKGAFEKSENDACFLKFVEKVVRALGDLVNEYITINEPNVYTMFGYIDGSWPPGKRSFSLSRRVMTRLCACHIKAYQQIHALRAEMGYSDTRVSFANHLRAFAPENVKSLRDCLCSRISARLFQGALTKAMCTGKISFPLRRDAAIERGEWCDFIAVNYYTRSTVHGIGDGTAKNVPVNDLGWEIYPQGIVECASWAYSILPRPIYITENGTCDNADVFRARYIYEHLRALCESELPIERYYHWCFCDNFEWLEGTSARFGLVHTDYETQARKIKQSGRFYSQIIREGGVSEEMYMAYCNTNYNMNGV